MANEVFRSRLTPEQRATALNFTIDPGFVHHRRIQTILGPGAMQWIDEQIKNLPDTPDWLRPQRINHIYTHALVWFCGHLRAPSLGELIANGRGRLFCSTEPLAPCADVYSQKSRAVSRWRPKGKYDMRVEFHYSISNISSDTIREQLRKGGPIAMVAELLSLDENLSVFAPLVMGNPWLEPGETTPTFDIMWFGSEFNQNFVEDVDEFAKVREEPLPIDPAPMRAVSENSFKRALAEILGDAVPKDWGGETSDYFAAHLHLQGRPITASFLLKGPARFAPMTLNHLGKNNDQIVRLAREPADMLVVQHCHDIATPVRDTLRAFAVQPSRPRRYCVIDGRESLRLLRAYGLYEKAVALSRKTKGR